MIDKINLHYSMNNPASVYDEEALTALELAGRTAAKVNEIVGDQNTLREETERSMRKQDETITTNISTIKTEIVPESVTSEVQKHIDNGDFFAQIDESMGNLTERVNNLTTSPTGSVSESEIVDSRVDEAGQTFSSLGKSIRHQSEYSRLDVRFGNYNNLYVDPLTWNTTGIQSTTEATHLSDPISVRQTWGTVYLRVGSVNRNRARVFFTLNNDVNSKLVSYILNDTVVGTIAVEPPYNAKYMWVAWDDGEPRPCVYVKNTDFLKNVSGRAETTYSFMDYVQKGYKGVYIGGWTNGYVDTSGSFVESDQFQHSAPIEVEEGEKLVITTNVNNPYIAKLCFNSDETLSTGNKIFVCPTVGRYEVIVPQGARYVYVMSDTDAGGNTVGTPVLYKSYDPYRYPYITKQTETLTLNLPKVYNLVVGKLFELFYKGIIKAVNPLDYDISVTCEKGNVYKRKFSYTPVAVDVGEKTLTITVKNNNGDVVASGSTILRINARPSNPSTEQRVLCIGDSLTAGGEWVAKCSQQLNNAGCTNVRFIGRKTSNGVSYEATSGYALSTYLSKDEANPFYNASSDSVSLTNYLSTIGETGVDIVCLFLGWNDRFTPLSTYEANLRTLITQFKTECPDVKFILFGLQTPDKDGLGESYGSAWDFMETVDFVYNHERVNNTVATSMTNVTIHTLNISGQFDTDYNMPTITRKVNNRNTVTETVISNGVHPSENGYNQISDIAYCGLVEMLKEVE